MAVFYIMIVSSLTLTTTISSSIYKQSKEVTTKDRINTVIASSFKHEAGVQALNQFENMSIDDLRQNLLDMAGRIIDADRRKKLEDELGKLSDDDLLHRREQMRKVRDTVLQRKSKHSPDDIRNAHNGAYKNVLKSIELKKGRF